MSLTTAEIDQYKGAELLDRSGDKVGTIKEFYLDDGSDRPEWALVDTGLFSSSSFVPIADAIPGDGRLTVPFDKATVTDAPRVDAGDHLDEAGERELYRHYDLTREPAPAAGGRRLRKRVVPADRLDPEGLAAQAQVPATSGAGNVPIERGGSGS